MWQTCRRLPDVDWWLTNGGGATLISYGQQQADQADATIVPAPHLDWVKRLPLMYVDKHRVFVHAGIDPNCPLDEQDAENVIWKIYPNDDDGGHGQRHVVHGHHQHAHGPILKRHRTNLDTFAWYTGRLAIGVFDDAAPGGPIEVLEVNGEPIDKRLRADSPPFRSTASSSDHRACCAQSLAIWPLDERGCWPPTRREIHYNETGIRHAAPRRALRNPYGN